MRLNNSIKKKQKIYVFAFTMLEIVASLVILSILATSFFMTVNNMNSVAKRTVLKSRSILILDNTLERISHLPDRNRKKIEQIFYDEFQKSPIAGKEYVTKICELRNNTLYLTINNRTKTVASVKINL